LKTNYNSFGSGNAIKGIGANNKKAGIYIDAAKKAFGQ
jgi:hypothetical protein